MIYLLFLILIVAVIGLLLLGNDTAHTESADPLDIYKAQLLELEADIEAGKINPEEAQAGKLEIQRRILRHGTKEAQAIQTTSPRPTFITLTAFVVAGSVGSYALLGSPKTPASPTSLAAMDAAVIAEDGTTLADALNASYNELEANPNNTEMRWRLANALLTLGRYGEAAKHLRGGVDLEPENPIWRVKLGEAVMQMHSGQVVPAAMLAFRSALKLDPNHPAALYYIGIGYAQSGQKDLALQVFEGLKKISEDNAEWLSLVDEQISALTGEPTGIASLSEADQKEMILGMVSSLEEKLANTPDDVEGWLLLARSKETLLGKDAARDVLMSALTKVNDADKARIQAALDDLN